MMVNARWPSVRSEKFPRIKLFHPSTNQLRIGIINSRICIQNTKDNTLYFWEAAKTIRFLTMQFRALSNFVDKNKTSDVSEKLVVLKL